MDAHDKNQNLSDVVEPRTEAERLELENAVAEYEAERAERAKVIHLADYGDQYTQAVARADSELALRQPAEVAPVEDKDPVVYVPERQRRSVVEAVGRLMPSGQALQRARSGQFTYVAKRGTGVVVSFFYSVTQGHLSWGKRTVDAWTHGPLRQAVQEARRAGDRTALAEASDRLEQAKSNRWNRLKAWPTTVIGVLKTAAIVGGVTVVLAIIVLKMMGVLDEVMALFGKITGLVAWVLSFADDPWAVLLLVVAWIWVARREGLRTGQPLRWVLTPEQRSTDTEITPHLLGLALAKVGNAELTRFFKGNGTLEFVVSPREQGGGTYCQIRLPMGVTAAKLLPSDVVETFAGNLGRHKHEVWPQRDPLADARVLDLWVADPGTMDKPSPPSPLLADDFGPVDVFGDSMPWGVTMRLDPVAIKVLQRHWLVAGVSKQGKTSAFRALALWLALDPTVELRISDLKGDGDWTMFRGLATELIEGQSDENELATAVMLEAAVREMRRRYDAKRDAEIVGNITRELSRRKGSGFHPIYLVLDEIQIGYASMVEDSDGPVGGKGKNGRLKIAAKRLHDQARAVNIHLLQATQRPSDNDGIPAVVREGAHIRASLHVPNLSAAKMVLGDVADMGARPQDLRSELDAGTVVLTGACSEAISRGQVCQIVRTHFIDTPQAWEIAKRAKEIRVKRGRDLVIAKAPAEPERVFLDDLHEAMRDEPKVLTMGVLGRLAELDVSYDDWAAGRLKAAMQAEGISARKRDGRMYVTLDDVDAARRRRES